MKPHALPLSRQDEIRTTSLKSFAPFRGVLLTALIGCPLLALATDVISISKPVNASIKPDGIYWNFDNGKLGEPDPNPTRDLSGNEFDGYLLPGVTGTSPLYTEGRFGTGITLKGSDPSEKDPRVSWNAAENPGSDESRLDMVGQDFTAGAWIKFNATKQGQAETFVVMERGYTSKQNSAWQLRVLKTPEDQGVLWFSLSEAYSRSSPLAEVSFSDGEWHHVAFTLKAMDGESTVTLWFDGEPIVEDTSLKGVIPPVEESGRNRIFTVGERNDHYHFSDSDVSVDEVFVTSGIYRFEP